MLPFSYVGMSEEVGWKGAENLGVKQLNSKAKEGQAAFYFNVSCILNTSIRPNLDVSLTLRLHYVPGDHGSPKRSAPCDLANFCLGTQVLLSIIMFRHGLSRYPLQTVG